MLRELNHYAFSLQSTQLTRTQNYSDDFTIHIQHPWNTPDWTLVEQNTPAGTDFSAPRTKIEDQDDVEDEIEHQDDEVEEE